MQFFLHTTCGWVTDNKLLTYWQKFNNNIVCIEGSVHKTEPLNTISHTGSKWTERQWTTHTYPGCRNWGRRSRRRSRCGVPALTCCWRCEHSLTPADKCSRKAGRSPEARWRSPAMLSESAPPSLVSIGSTCQGKWVSLSWSDWIRRSSKFDSIFSWITREWSRVLDPFTRSVFSHTSVISDHLVFWAWSSYQQSSNWHNTSHKKEQQMSV